MTTERSIAPAATQETPGLAPARGLAPLYWLMLGFAAGVVTLLLGLLLHPLAGAGFLLASLLATALVIRLLDPTANPLHMAVQGTQAVLAWLNGAFRRANAAVAPYMTQISREFGVLAVFLLALSAWHYALGGDRWLEKAALLLLGGGASLLAALVTGWQHHTGPFDTTLPTYERGVRQRTRTRFVPAILGALLLFIVAEISGDVFAPDFLADTSIHVQALLLIAGITLLTWGAAGHRVGGAERVPLRVAIPAFLRAHRAELLAVAVILGLAAFARVFLIGSAIHLFIDEIHFTTPIVSVQETPTVELLTPFSSVAAFPYTFPYLQWWFVEPLGFGRNLVGLRLLAAVLGVANVAALYLMARELFGVRVALVAAALLAVFPPHLQYSRIGLNNIADPIFGMLAVYFLVRGLRRQAHMRVNFALAGAMLGLTQYWYEGGRLLYPPVIVTWAVGVGVVMYALVSSRYLLGVLLRREADRQAAGRFIDRLDLPNMAKSLLVLVVVALLVAAPVYYTLLSMDRPLSPRLETAGLRDNVVSQMDDAEDVLRHMGERLHTIYLMHVAIPEAWLYYGGYTATLLAFMVPFFFAGVFYAAWRFDMAGAALLFIWIAATWVGNTLMHESRISARYVVAYPALMLLVAIGMVGVLRALWPRNPRTRNRLLAALLSAFVVFNFTYYFGSHTQALSDQFRADRNLGRDSHDVLFRAAAMPPGTQVIMIGQPTMSNIDANGYLYYLNPELSITTYQTNDLPPGYFLSLPKDKDYAFFVEPTDAVTLARLAQHFPHATGPAWSPWDVPEDEQYVMFYARRRYDTPAPPEATTSP